MGAEITDPDLAAATAGRDHWAVVGENLAEYDPGQPAVVRVGRIANPPRSGPDRHDRYYAVLVRDGRAEHRVVVGFASEAVRWAERVRLD